MKRNAVAILVALCGVSLFAKTTTWTGGSTGLFSSAANWDNGAPGAVRYLWTKNGEEIADATAKELSVAWTRGGAADVYAVAPVFQMVDGSEKVGDAVLVTVENSPLGMTLIVR